MPLLFHTFSFALGLASLPLQLAFGLAAAHNLLVIAVWFLPVLYLNCGWLIAAVLWAWWRMQRLRRARHVAAALGLLVALVFASQEFAMIALALVALDLVARAPRPPGCWGSTGRGRGARSMRPARSRRVGGDPALGARSS